MEVNINDRYDIQILVNAYQGVTLDTESKTIDYHVIEEITDNIEIKIYDRQRGTGVPSKATIQDVGNMDDNELYEAILADIRTYEEEITT